MQSLFRKTFWLSLATFLNRILGFIRELLLARFLGCGVMMSAWSYAWMLPNMFRRILGEGALGTVLIPVLTETFEKEGYEAGQKKFSTVVIWLFFLLTLITVLFAGAALILEPFIEPERWKLALLTVPVIMPYCILICCVGVFTSVLNTFQIFVRPALMELLPNLFFIGTVYFFLPELMDTPVKALRVISVAMLISGTLEFICLGIILHKQKMFPKVSRQILVNFPVLREIWKKLLPGLVGASALQIGSLVDASLAMGIGDYAKAAIHYSDRLVYLPIGIFGVAFGVVSLPMLSKFIAENKFKSMLISSFKSIRQMLFITIPVTVLMAIFSKDLLKMFFYGGKFDDHALNEAHQAMFWFVFGIPFFCLIKLVVNTFYCRKDMKTPAAVSICCIILNLILSIILRESMKQGGLTLATVVASVVNNVVLLWILRKELGRMPLAGTVKFAGIILMLSVISGAGAYWSHQWLQGHPEWHFLPRGIIPLFGGGCVFMMIFVCLCLIFRIHELRALIIRFQQKLSRKKKRA